MNLVNQYKNTRFVAGLLALVVYVASIGLSLPPNPDAFNSMSHAHVFVYLWIALLGTVIIIRICNIKIYIFISLAPIITCWYPVLSKNFLNSITYHVMMGILILVCIDIFFQHFIVPIDTGKVQADNKLFAVFMGLIVYIMSIYAFMPGTILRDWALIAGALISSIAVVGIVLLNPKTLFIRCVLLFVIGITIMYGLDKKIYNIFPVQLVITFAVFYFLVFWETAAQTMMRLLEPQLNKKVKLRKKYS